MSLVGKKVRISLTNYKNSEYIGIIQDKYIGIEEVHTQVSSGHGGVTDARTKIGITFYIIKTDKGRIISDIKPEEIIEIYE